MGLGRRVMVYLRDTLVWLLPLLLLLPATLFFLLLAPFRNAPEPVIFPVERGHGLKEVAGGLTRAGLIPSPCPLTLWARLHPGRTLKAGEYRLTPLMSPLEILDTLWKGAAIAHPVTIPEGLTLDQIGRLLDTSGLCDAASFLRLARDPEVSRDLGLPLQGLEGYIFPDTYFLVRGQSPRRLIDTMVKRFQERVAPYRERIAETGMSLQEIVTLASIVEKETGVPEERPLIAGVFLNRLKLGMRLESDPTVIYGLSNFDGNLRRKDLETPTPFNTYRIQGLPPHPIANPGIEAIKAVLYPADTPFLYFVSKNNGSHHFSKTYEEHRRAVQRLQKGGGPAPEIGHALP